MLEAALALTLVLAAVTGAAVALCRVPGQQVLLIGLNGLVLSCVFMLLRAPDVALSELVVGTAALPLLYLSVIVSLRTDRPGEGDQGSEAQGQGTAPPSQERG